MESQQKDIYSSSSSRELELIKNQAEKYKYIDEADEYS